MTDVLADIIDMFIDPIDGTDLKFGGTERMTLKSESGYSYDVVRQGYATLADGAGLRYTGDDAKIITAREEFLSGGRYAPFVKAVTGSVQDVLDDANVSEAASPVICEVGAGTGYYLVHTLDSTPDSRGVGTDVFVPAAKHLAKSHPRFDAIVTDTWARLPLRDGSTSALTVIFAPHNVEEFARVLKSDGQVVVLTATTGHLGELREPLGITNVKRGKVERMISQAEGHLVPTGDPELVGFSVNLNQSAIAAQIGMSPSARHIHPEVLQERIAALSTEMHITTRAYVTRLGRPGDWRLLLYLGFVNLFIQIFRIQVSIREFRR